MRVFVVHIRSRVMVKGLNAAAHYNGKYGIVNEVIEKDGEERLCVVLETDGRQLSVKRANAQVVKPRPGTSCTHMYTHRVYTCPYVVHTHIYVCACVSEIWYIFRTRAYAYAHVLLPHARTHMRARARTHARTHACTHTHTNTHKLRSRSKSSRHGKSRQRTQ